MAGVVTLALVSKVRLAIVDGPDTGREFELAGVTVVGRDPSAGIVLADTEVSRRHASLRREDDRTVVEDLGSLNGTFVNGERIKESRLVTDSDKLRLGRTVLQLRAEAPVTRVASPGSGKKKEELQAAAENPSEEPQTGPGSG